MAFFAESAAGRVVFAPRPRRLRATYREREKGHLIRSRSMTAIEVEARYCAHNYEPIPVVLARGEGACLWDTSGRRYIDMMSAYSAASHGHAHPRIVAALEAQARR